MTLQEFHQQMQELLYLEDLQMVDIVLASIISNSLQIGDPVWLTLIGPSSGGKSQLIRPFAMANPDYIHQVDDLTDNTFISGTLGLENSLLGRIKEAGIISMDDLTVLFSKNAEQRAAILSQFRMLYDGRFSKSTGNRKEAMEWRGHVGMIAGSTPSIYRYFSEVADMGERFISYRMKSIHIQKAVEFVSAHPHTAKNLNGQIADLIKDFLPPLLASLPEPKYRPKLSEDTILVIQEAAQLCTLLRTPIHLDERSFLVDEFPEPEMPFRVMKQLTYLAQGLQYLQDDPAAPLSEHHHNALRWVAYSLANDKRRAYIRAIAALDYHGANITTRNVSATTGLHNDIVARGLSQFQALKIISLTHEEDGGRREYRINNQKLCRFVREIEKENLDITIKSDHEM